MSTIPSSSSIKPSLSNSKPRIISLIDCDCFYASVESQRLNLSHSIPLVVYQNTRNIISVNYEARKYNINRGDTIKQAIEKYKDIKIVYVESYNDKCEKYINLQNNNKIKAEETERINKNLKLLEENNNNKSNFNVESYDSDSNSDDEFSKTTRYNGKASIERYRQANQVVISVLSRYSKFIERASVDEVFVDLTDEVDSKVISMKKIGAKFNISELDFKGHIFGHDITIENGIQLLNSKDDIKLRYCIASNIVFKMREAVFKELGYPLSAGIAPNKIFAKVAASFNRPNDQTCLLPTQVNYLLQTIPLSKFRGFGGALGSKVFELQIVTASDLLNKFPSLNLMQNEFGNKNGSFLWDLSHGINNEPVKNRDKLQSLISNSSFPPIVSFRDPYFGRKLKLITDDLFERVENEIKINNRQPTLITVQWTDYINDTSSSKSKSLPFRDSNSIFSSLNNYFENTSEAFPLVGINICLTKMIDLLNKNQISNFFNAPNSSIKIENPHSNTKNEFICIDDLGIESKKRKIEVIDLDDECIICIDEPMLTINNKVASLNKNPKTINTFFNKK